MPHPLKTLSACALVLLACSGDSGSKTTCGDDAATCGEGSSDGGKRDDSERDGSGPDFISHAGDSSVGDSGNVEPMKPEVCADIDVAANRVTPTVILIVDQSGSMTDEFDNGNSRWDVLRSFLLDDTGLIAKLQTQVKFGLAMYSARSIPDGTMVDGKCPLVTGVDAKLSNLKAIAKVYNAAEPIKETPTGDAIMNVLSGIPLPDSGPDSSTDPIVFILATDGEPDRCEDPNPIDDAGYVTAKKESISAVKAAFKRDIRTFIISVGVGSVSAAHQQDVANAGVGHKAGDPDAEYWVAGDDTTLRKALRDIIGSQLSCDIKLKGKIDESVVCDGKVLLDGAPLGCNDKNGWKYIDPSHIRLVGTACETLKTTVDATLHVSFPCGTPILF